MQSRLGGSSEPLSQHHRKVPRLPTIRFAYLMVVRELYIDFLSSFCRRQKVVVFPQAIRDRISDVRRVIEDQELPTIVEATPSAAAWLLCNYGEHDPLYIIGATHAMTSRLCLYGTIPLETGKFQHFLHPGEQVVATQLAEMYLQLRSRPFNPYTNFAAQDLGDFTAVKESLDRLCANRQALGSFPTDLIAVLGGSRDSEFRQSWAGPTLSSLGLNVRKDLAGSVYDIIKQRAASRTRVPQLVQEIQSERGIDDIPSGLLLASRSTLTAFEAPVVRFLNAWHHYVGWLTASRSEKARRLLGGFRRHGFLACDADQGAQLLNRAMTFTRLVHEVLPHKKESSNVLPAFGYLPRTSQGAFMLDEESTDDEPGLLDLVPAYQQDMMALQTRVMERSDHRGTAGELERRVFQNTLGPAHIALEALKAKPCAANFHRLGKLNMSLHAAVKEIEECAQKQIVRKRVTDKEITLLAFDLTQKQRGVELWTHKQIQQELSCTAGVALRISRAIRGGKARKPGRPKMISLEQAGIN